MKSAGMIRLAGVASVTLSAAAVAAPPFVEPVDARIVNDAGDPIPVALERRGELALLREGYTVPSGKVLVIQDASVKCRNDTGFSSTAAVRVRTPAGSCLEPTFVSPETGATICPDGVHFLGTVEASLENGPGIFDGGAGRQLSVVVAEGATLVGECQGIAGPSAIISGGNGRLIDTP